MIIRANKLHRNAVLPTYAHDGDAGADLVATSKAYIAPGHWATVGTGVSIELPPGQVGLVCPRSGLAAKRGLTVLNAPGVIDSGYRGEVGVCLINLSRQHQSIEPGERIAQLLIMPVESHAVIEWTKDDLALTSPDGRGAGGFGSTGV